MARFDIITIFPQLIADYAKISIIARAIKKKLISIKAHNLRDFTNDGHKTVDGRPYGGGAGMVLRADVMQKAIGKIVTKKSKKSLVVLLSPQGKVFTQSEAKKLSKYQQLVLVCGRYEGFDERINKMTDAQYSIGDYVLMGGELPALVVIEAVSRYIPDVVGKTESVQTETFSEANKGLLEYPQYTRPEFLKKDGKTLRVPKILLSGNHKAIEKWRLEQALKKTKRLRPELLNKNNKLKQNLE